MILAAALLICNLQRNVKQPPKKYEATSKEISNSSSFTGTIQARNKWIKILIAWTQPMSSYTMCQLKNGLLGRWHIFRLKKKYSLNTKKSKRMSAMFRQNRRKEEHLTFLFLLIVNQLPFLYLNPHVRDGQYWSLSQCLIRAHNVLFTHTVKI